MVGDATQAAGPPRSLVFGLCLVLTIALLLVETLLQYGGAACSIGGRDIFANLLSLFRAAVMALGTLSWSIFPDWRRNLRKPVIWGELALFTIMWLIIFPAPCSAQLLGSLPG